MRSSATRSPSPVKAVVLPRDAGLRLDQFLAAATSLSRRGARRLISEGRVRRNSRITRVASRALSSGDIIVIEANESDCELSLPQAESPVARIFEDKWLIAVNKPAGILSQASEESHRRELALDEQLLIELAQDRSRPQFLRLIHRLDRIASGVLLFARHADALSGLSKAWRRGAVVRHYLAVVSGEPDFKARVIEEPIARDNSHTWRFRTSGSGKPARTLITPICSISPGVSLVACQLLTGRTHQVRVHLESIDHPLVADRLYGGKPRATIDRPVLHAWSLGLRHPTQRRKLQIMAPPPDWLLQHLRNRGVDETGLSRFFDSDL